MFDTAIGTHHNDNQENNIVQETGIGINSEMWNPSGHQHQDQTSPLHSSLLAYTNCMDSNYLPPLVDGMGGMVAMGDDPNGECFEKQMSEWVESHQHYSGLLNIWEQVQGQLVGDHELSSATAQSNMEAAMVGSFPSSQ